LEVFAEKKGTDVATLTATILSTGGPSFSGTKADAVKFHDDKSLYTGVYAQGGPTNVDSVHPSVSFGGSATTEEEKKETVLPGVKKSVQADTVSQPAGSLEEVFMGFTKGAHEMDGKTFAKMAKDTKILDKKLTATDVDLVFNKVKDKAARKINFG